MNTDFRAAVGLPTHPKTIKLKRLIGPIACEVLWRLFGFAAVNHPNGDLSGMDDETIAIAAGGEEAQIELVSYLVKVGFLEGREGHRRIHDWDIHNPYATNAEARIKKARDAANSRWSKERGNNPTDDDLNSVLDDATSNTTSINEQCPSVASVASVAKPTEPTPPPPTSPTPTGIQHSADQAEAVRLLETFLVPESQALELLQKEGLPAIQGQVGWMKYNHQEAKDKGDPIRNETAFIIWAIKSHRPPPASYLAEVEARKQAKERAAAKVVSEKKETEREQERARNGQLSAYFDHLPAEEQARIDGDIAAHVEKSEKYGDLKTHLVEFLRGNPVAEVWEVSCRHHAKRLRRQALQSRVSADWKPPAKDPDPPPKLTEEAIDATKRTVSQLAQSTRPSNVKIDTAGLVKAMPGG